jgi:hypothetical protein
VRQFTPKTLTVAARTLKTAPASVTWTLYPGWVHTFRVDIPTGHNGLTGVRIVYKGTPIIPFDQTSYLVGSGHTFQVPYEDEIDDTGLAVQAFNSDAFPHTFYLWADVNPYGPRNALEPMIRPLAAFVPRSAADAIAALARTDA